VIFLVAALRAAPAADGTRSLARRAWLRIAIIFAVVGMALQVVPVLVRH
jgi:hypothetical protein